MSTSSSSRTDVNFFIDLAPREEKLSSVAKLFGVGPRPNLSRPALSSWSNAAKSSPGKSVLQMFWLAYPRTESQYSSGVTISSISKTFSRQVISKKNTRTLNCLNILYIPSSVFSLPWFSSLHIDGVDIHKLNYSRIKERRCQDFDGQIIRASSR